MGCLPVILAQGGAGGPVVKVILEISLGYGRPCLEKKEVGRGKGRVNEEARRGTGVDCHS